MRYLLILFSFIHFSNLAQRELDQEIGVYIGGSFYLGELNQKVFSQIGPAGGVLYRLNFASNRVSLRANANYSLIQGDDAKSNKEFNRYRNLNFKNTIFEISGMVELNFFEYEISPSSSRSNVNFSPYLFFGIGYLNSAPYVKVINNKYDLKSLGTEGQSTDFNSDKYSNNQIIFPIGLGIRFNLYGAWAMSVEWGMRKTYTDYLDDVGGYYVGYNNLLETNGELSAQQADKSEVEHVLGEKRGNPDTKDWYSNFGVLITYRIGGAKGTCHHYRRF